jgi:katanin p80 WD40 repeat-containing subunit B1
MSNDDSQTAASPTHRPRSNVFAYSSKGSSFVPVVFPRHSSKVDAGPNLTESTTTDLRTVDRENLLKGHLVTDHGKEVRQCVFPSKCSTSKRNHVTETSGDGDINYFGPLCTEGVESNEVGDWYDVSDLEETKSEAGRNPEFKNVNRTAVFVGTGRLRGSYERSQNAPTLEGLVMHYLKIFILCYVGCLCSFC